MLRICYLNIMSKKYYQETVDVKGKKFWIGTLVLIFLLSIMGFFEKRNLAENWIGIMGIGLAILGIVTGIYLITRTKMKTKVTSKSTKVKLSPFYRSKVKIPHADIVSYRLEKTKPFTIRTSKTLNTWFEKRFTLTGRNGISITTSEGYNYFIGSTNPKELHNALKKACEN